MKCGKCANKETMICVICDNEDMFRTKEQKEYEEYLCDLMCGFAEESECEDAENVE